MKDLLRIFIDLYNAWKHWRLRRRERKRRLKEEEMRRRLANILKEKG